MGRYRLSNDISRWVWTWLNGETLKVDIGSRVPQKSVFVPVKLNTFKLDECVDGMMTRSADGLRWEGRQNQDAKRT